MRRPTAACSAGSAPVLQIVDATIELIHAGNPRTDQPEIADHAGVSVRMIFYHFGADRGPVPDRGRLASSCATGRSSPSCRRTGPVEARIRATCRQRRQLFEAIAPVLRMAYSRVARLADSPTSVLAEKRALLRRQVAVTLRPEISIPRIRRPGAPRDAGPGRRVAELGRAPTRTPGTRHGASEDLMASALIDLLVTGSGPLTGGSQPATASASPVSPAPTTGSR